MKADTRLNVFTIAALKTIIILIFLQCCIYGQYGLNTAKESSTYKIHYLNGDKAQGYVVLLPGNYNSTESYPVLITLHGNGGDAGSMAGAFEAYSRLPVIIVAPQGQYPKARGYSWFNETVDKSKWEVEDKKCIDYLVQIIKDVQKYYKMDNLFLLGFSQGASLAYMAGFRHPSMFRGIAAIGGSLPAIDTEGSVVKMEDIKNADGLKVFVARGVDDSLVPKRFYDYQIKFLNENDYDVDSYEYNGPHDLTADLLREIYRWLRKYSG